LTFIEFTGVMMMLDRSPNHLKFVPNPKSGGVRTAAAFIAAAAASAAVALLPPLAEARPALLQAALLLALSGGVMFALPAVRRLRTLPWQTGAAGTAEEVVRVVQTLSLGMTGGTLYIVSDGQQLRVLSGENPPRVLWTIAAGGSPARPPRPQAPRARRRARRKWRALHV
jgi:hypothetical protein